MKEIKLYNVIFPIWFLWILPPVILVSLTGNFIIDSLVLLISVKLLKATNLTGYSMKDLYKKTILKVWGFGFLADIAGMAPLFIFFAVGIKSLKIPSEITSAVTMNPLSNIWAFLIVFACMVLASVLIYVFNYNITFKKTIQQKALRVKISLIVAIVTAPWTFLLPIEWFYKGY
jgi:hypothetical protein